MHPSSSALATPRDAGFSTACAAFRVTNLPRDLGRFFFDTCRVNSYNPQPLPRWRNWQTHQVQVLAVATLWGFESLPRHHLKTLPCTRKAAPIAPRPAAPRLLRTARSYPGPAPSPPAPRDPRAAIAAACRAPSLAAIPKFP